MHRNQKSKFEHYRESSAAVVQAKVICLNRQSRWILGRQSNREQIRCYLESASASLAIQQLEIIMYNMNILNIRGLRQI